jgi:hypothetical protein
MRDSITIGDSEIRNQGLNQLYGSWRLISAKVQIIGVDAEPRDLFGPEPLGRLILTADHHMIVFLSAGSRKPPTNEAEAAAMMSTMLAYTGKYRLEGDKFITTVDGSWNEATRGRDLIRAFKVEGDKLTVHVPEQPSGVAPGKANTGDLIFERER